MGFEDWIVSVDDHLIEPPDLWVDRVARADRDRAPRVVAIDGVDTWVYEDARATVAGSIAVAGRPAGEVSPAPINYGDMREAYYDPAARVADMDLDGVAASLCFPMVPRYCGQLFLEAKDRDLALRCLRVFNDWVLDEWCGVAPGRFIPLVVVPLWDPRLAAEELERCVAKGARAVSFSENPHKLGLPSIHDDGGYWGPLLRAADDAAVPLCIHFGSSSSLPTTSPDAPMVVWASLAPVNLMFTMVDWLFSRQLSRYENLRIVMAEGGIGWIPYLLERCDRTLRRGEEWYGQGDYEFDFALGRSARREGVAGIDTDVLPSELFRRHFYGCFIDDYVGVEQIGSIGVDNVMMESDYPHSDGSFPGTRASVASMLDRFPEDQRWQLQCGNAIRLFDLVPSVPDVADRHRRSSPQEAPLR